MARGLPVGLSWALALAALGLAALAGLGLDLARWQWQAHTLWQEPWRLWTCALVHGSPLHAGANALGALLLAWLGWRARLGRRDLLALALSWPLTHALLALRADLPAYFGASGLLHAAATLVGLGLLRGQARERRIGCAFLAVLALKLLAEQPWGPSLRYEPLWSGMATVPWGHLTGGLAAGASHFLLRFLPRPCSGRR